MNYDENKYEFILQHGWGLSSSCFFKWKDLLKDHILNLPDRGYFGNRLDIESFKSNRKKILVSHSFGLHLFSDSLLKKADYLIIISGFSGFHPKDKKGKRRSSMLMRLMKKKILTQPEKMLNEFYNGHSLIGKKDIVPDKELLYKDLESIDEYEVNINAIKKINNVLILHGKNDMVVPYSRALFLKDRIPGAKIIGYEKSDHALPFTNTEEVILNILDFIKDKT